MTTPSKRPRGASHWKPEHCLEFNALLGVGPMLYLQPVVQDYANAAAGLSTP